MIVSLKVLGIFDRFFFAFYWSANKLSNATLYDSISVLVQEIFPCVKNKMSKKVQPPPLLTQRFDGAKQIHYIASPQDCASNCIHRFLISDRFFPFKEI